jgi:hypothetical protein
MMHGEKGLRRTCIKNNKRMIIIEAEGGPSRVRRRPLIGAKADHTVAFFARSI